MNSNQRSHFGVLALICLAGSLAGGFLAHAVLADDPTPPEMPPPPPGPDPLPAIAEVLAEIRRLRDELSASQAARVAAGSGAAAADAGTSTLLDRLAALIADLENSASTAPFAVPVSEIARLAPARGAERLLNQVAGWKSPGGSWSEAVGKFREQHLLWSTREVLRNYGMPFDVDTSGGKITFAYRTADSEIQVLFELTDGLVTNVSADY